MVKQEDESGSTTLSDGSGLVSQFTITITVKKIHNLSEYNKCISAVAVRENKPEVLQF